MASFLTSATDPHSNVCQLSSDFAPFFWKLQLLVDSNPAWQHWNVILGEQLPIPLELKWLVAWLINPTINQHVMYQA